MNEKQRDKGRAVTLIVIISILLLGMCSSCATQHYMNKIVVTHVLAITSNGDTIRVPIEQIQPTKIYNVIGYDFNRPYYNGNSYYRDWRFFHDNYNNNWNKASYGGVNIYGNIKSIHPTTYSGGGSNVQNPVINTTGGGNNPVAINPVTSGGGSKKENN